MKNDFSWKELRALVRKGATGHISIKSEISLQKEYAGASEACSLAIVSKFGSDP